MRELDSRSQRRESMKQRAEWLPKKRPSLNKQHRVMDIAGITATIKSVSCDPSSRKTEAPQGRRDGL